MSIHVSYFRSHVVKSATNALLFEVFKQLTRPAEITQLNVEVVIEQKVFRFDVPVNDAFLVQMTDS